MSVLYPIEMPKDCGSTEGAICYIRGTETPSPPLALKLVVHNKTFYSMAYTHPRMPTDRIGLSSRWRTALRAAYTDPVAVSRIECVDALRAVTFAISTPQKIGRGIDRALLERTVRNSIRYVNTLPIACRYAVDDDQSTIMNLTVIAVNGKDSADFTIGTIVEDTFIAFESLSQIFTDSDTFDVDISKMNVGGCKEQLGTMLRRAFSTRMLPQNIIDELHIQHVRGMILYGPAGTGKTLIARELAGQLKCTSIKVVSGPEILDKYVGSSEEKTRQLFEAAESDHNPRNLHMIVCDEFDALCRTRGSSGSAGTMVGDNIVNQLLSKLDGFNQLNNVFFVAMTNRIDLLDPAIMRPGRLELKLEIGLPDSIGRREIMQIHTKELREHNYLAPEVQLDAIADRLKDYTGAELKGVIEAARSYAISRKLGKDRKSKDKFIITVGDFEDAILRDIKPKYGFQPPAINVSIVNIDRWISFDQQFSKYIGLGDRVSILVTGPTGSGKTSMIFKSIEEHTKEYVCVRSITLNEYGRLMESGRLALLDSTFDSCLRANSSLLFIDDLDRLIDWSPLGARYNNNILQAVLTHMRLPSTGKFHIIVSCTVNRTNPAELLEIDNMFTGSVLIGRLSVNQ